MSTETALSARDMQTPEGVNLGVRLADVSTRFGALMIDLLIMLGGLLLGGIIVSAARIGGDASFTVFILIFFFLRSFYFTAFEMGPRAATPGKRVMGIRVASRRGARLPTSAVFARNALREIELFLPITVLLSGSVTGQYGVVDQWIWLAAVVWTLLFAMFPLFNRDRLRAGDLVAGTWVVRAPKPDLLPDLSDSPAAKSAQYAFTPAHLSAYGVAELHVLEDVLRQRDPEIMREVAERIASKIGWAITPDQTAEGFLRAYYRGLGGELETGLLMGRRRADKYDTQG